MSYSYQVERSIVFTDDGIQFIIKVIDFVNSMRNKTSVLMMQDFTRLGNKLNEWQMMACVHYLVEIKWLSKVQSELTAGQHEIFSTIF